MYLVIFVILWFFMFSFQFRAIEKYDGSVNMRNYTFCSNLIISFPKWLVSILFFNIRLTRIPVTVFVGQLINYCCLIVHVLFELSGAAVAQLILLRICGILFILLDVVMCIDHEIYCMRQKDNII